MAGDVMPGDEGWDRWGNHVILELQRQDGNAEKCREEIDKIKLDLNALMVRVGIYSVLGGFIATAVFELGLWWISRH